MSTGSCPECGQYPDHAVSCPLDWSSNVAELTTFRPARPEGVWAIVDIDHGESITKVYATEIDALREINGRGYGRVVYVPFGKDLRDIDTEEARVKKLRQQLAGTPVSSDAGSDS